MSAFFVFIFYSFVFSYPVFSASLQEDCPSFHSQQRVSIAFVIDGDTVQLTDKRRVRLVGMNTPELKEGSALSRRFAQQAKEALQNWIEQRRSLYLSQDQSSRDHYGRQLSYLHDGKGNDAGAFLLSQGLAYAVAIAPDLQRVECYFSLEKQARAARLGIWMESPIKALDRERFFEGGFGVYRGEVSAILKFKRSFALVLNERLVVMVKLSESAPYALGDKVVVRGWLRQKKFVYKKQSYGYQMLLNSTHNIEKI